MQTPKFRIFAHQMPPPCKVPLGAAALPRPPLAAPAESWPLYHTLFANFELQAVITHIGQPVYNLPSFHTV